MHPKEETELFKAGLAAGIRYAEQRGAVVFEKADSPMPEEQVSEKSMRHPIAMWHVHQRLKA